MSSGGSLVNLLAGVVVAPISEEIMFRGFATTAWMRDMGRWRGVIRGALFFAVVHVLTISGVEAGQALAVAAAAFLGRIPVALALGWLFARRGHDLGAARASCGVQRRAPRAGRGRGQERGRARLRD